MRICRIDYNIFKTRQEYIIYKVIKIFGINFYVNEVCRFKITERDNAMEKFNNLWEKRRKF